MFFVSPGTRPGSYPILHVCWKIQTEQWDSSPLGDQLSVQWHQLPIGTVICCVGA